MDITIDINRIFDIINQHPASLLWYLISHGGWLVLIIAFLSSAFSGRLWLKRREYQLAVEQTLLAIDIPKDNEQSLVAVEQIFVTLAGIKSKGNLIERYWYGKTQMSFSLEIISLEGYIQFLIRTPSQFRDLVEAAVYAQYPEAEITEVEDYIKLIPEDVHRLDSNYNLWGTEFTLAKFSAYPVKTYRSFEHPLTQIFVDPMASMLEVMSKLGPGEQLGLQLVIAPVDDDWKERGYLLVKKLIGEKSAASKNMTDKLIEASAVGLEKFSETIYKIWGDIEDKDDEKVAQTLYQHLTVNQKGVVEAIENKLAKISFATSFRVYYLAHVDKFKKGRGVNPIIGAINQFNSSDLNAFKKNKRFTTDADYFFVKRRISRIQKKLLKLYKKRWQKKSREFFLGTEELATIYHFPTITVKAPLLKKAESKKAEAPTTLPLEEVRQSEFFKTEQSEQGTNESAPSEEPDYTIAESLPGYDFDNDYFEDRFKKDKTTIKTPSPVTGEATEEPPTNLPIA